MGKVGNEGVLRSLPHEVRIAGVALTSGLRALLGNILVSHSEAPLQLLLHLIVTGCQEDGPRALVVPVEGAREGV